MQLTLTLNMTTAQVVQKDTVNNNSPILDYDHLDDYVPPTSSWVCFLLNEERNGRPNDSMAYLFWENLVFLNEILQCWPVLWTRIRNLRLIYFIYVLYMIEALKIRLWGVKCVPCQVRYSGPFYFISIPLFITVISEGSLVLGWRGGGGGAFFCWVSMILKLLASNTSIVKVRFGEGVAAVSTRSLFF